MLTDSQREREREKDMCTIARRIGGNGRRQIFGEQTELPVCSRKNVPPRPLTSIVRLTG